MQQYQTYNYIHYINTRHGSVYTYIYIYIHMIMIHKMACHIDFQFLLVYFLTLCNLPRMAGFLKWMRPQVRIVPSAVTNLQLICSHEGPFGRKQTGWQNTVCMYVLCIYLWIYIYICKKYYIYIYIILNIYIYIYLILLYYIKLKLLYCIL